MRGGSQVGQFAGNAENAQALSDRFWGGSSNTDAGLEDEPVPGGRGAIVMAGQPPRQDNP